MSYSSATMITIFALFCPFWRAKKVSATLSSPLWTSSPYFSSPLERRGITKSWWSFFHLGPSVETLNPDKVIDFGIIWIRFCNKISKCYNMWTTSDELPERKSCHSYNLRELSSLHVFFPPGRFNIPDAMPHSLPQLDIRTSSNDVTINWQTYNESSANVGIINRRLQSFAAHIIPVTASSIH